MHISLSQLECFAAAAELQHITRAAERLNLSQPAVSKKISQLEAELNVQLFERIGKKVFLTPAGKVLQKRTNELQSKIGNIIEEVKKVEKDSALPIKIVIRALGGIVMDILSDFNSDYPGVKLITLQDDNSSIQKMEYDLIITFSNELLNGKSSELLVQETLMLAVSKNSPLAKREQISLTELNDVPMIQFSKNRMLHTWCKRILENAGITPNTRIECDNATSAKVLVSNNVGAMLIPKYTWKLSDSDNIILLPVDNNKYSRYVSISYKKGYYISSETRSLFNYIVRAFHERNLDHMMEF